MIGKVMPKKVVRFDEPRGVAPHKKRITQAQILSCI